jgi:hypothetical protein
MIAGASLTEALERARPLLSEAARYRLGFADQQAQFMWARYVADTLRELQQQDPERCYLMMSGAALDGHGGALKRRTPGYFMLCSFAFMSHRTEVCDVSARPARYLQLLTPPDRLNDNAQAIVCY